MYGNYTPAAKPALKNEDTILSEVTFEHLPPRTCWRGDRFISTGETRCYILIARRVFQMWSRLLSVEGEALHQALNQQYMFFLLPLECYPKKKKLDTRSFVSSICDPSFLYSQYGDANKNESKASLVL
jgi:hypothetical protein